MRVLEVHEPDENGNDVVTYYSREMAIQLRHAVAQTAGCCYINDEEGMRAKLFDIFTLLVVTIFLLAFLLGFVLRAIVLGAKL